MKRKSEKYTLCYIGDVPMRSVDDKEHDLIRYYYTGRDQPLHRAVHRLTADWHEYLGMKKLGRSADELASYLDTHILTPARSFRKMKPKTRAGAAAQKRLVEMLSMARARNWNVSILDLQIERGEVSREWVAECTRRMAGLFGTARTTEQMPAIGGMQ